MTRFEKDLQRVIDGDEIEVITERRNEIQALKDELGRCKNNFRSECLAQEIASRRNEFSLIINRAV